MTAVATATIDLGALRHNLATLRRAAPHSRVLAVVKANAYGHGLVTVARALTTADGYAVARVGEAVALRESGIEKPILVLNGPMDVAEVQDCARLALSATVHHDSQIRMLEEAGTEHPLSVWLKVDSGMHRLGIAPGKVRASFDALAHCVYVRPAVKLMTHLANADDRDDGYTREQLLTFESATAGLPGERSLANSAGVLGWPQSHADWSRPGIALYGCSPFNSGVGADLGLQPGMTLGTRLIAVNHYNAGAPIGYGGTWRCPRDSRIGVAAVGYGDGYPRHAPSGTPVLVGGQRASLAGRVSMDTVCIDITDHPEVDVGAQVVLWGRGLPVEDIAAAAGTIGYELLAGVTARVQRVALTDTPG